MTQIANASRTLAVMLLPLSSDEAMAVEIGARHFLAGPVTTLLHAIVASCRIGGRRRAFR